MNTSAELFRTGSWLLFWVIVLSLAGVAVVSFAISDEIAALTPQPRWAVL